MRSARRDDWGQCNGGGGEERVPMLSRGGDHMEDGWGQWSEAGSPGRTNLVRDSSYSEDRSVQSPATIRKKRKVYKNPFFKSDMEF